jgi:hypothetical protein
MIIVQEEFGHRKAHPEHQHNDQQHLGDTHVESGLPHAFLEAIQQVEAVDHLQYLFAPIGRAPPSPAAAGTRQTLLDLIDIETRYVLELLRRPAGVAAPHAHQNDCDRQH